MSATANRRRRSWAWRYRRLLFLVVLLLFTTGAGGLYVLAQVPLPAELPLAETTFLTDAGGARLASFDDGEDRVPVPLSSVPAVLVNAVLAAEDKNFFSHRGLDPVGIARAAIADLRGRPLQGGSTITQQYVKNTFGGRERTIWRKLREASLALKVERKYDKAEILERYLNTVYFGRGAYGVDAAGRAWFDKELANVTLPEAAYLAGLIRAPETADVDRDPEAALQRRDSTLRAMARRGDITEEERRAAQAVPMRASAGGSVIDRRSQEPAVALADKGTHYFVEYVRRELLNRYGEAATDQRGLRVRTTLDLDLQAKAYDAVYKVLNRPDDPAGALVAVDSNGDVKAMVGGRNFAESKVNLAVGREGGGTGRQAGSVFKPFVLAAVVRDGYTVESAFKAPSKIVLPKADNGKDYPVSNYEEADFGESLNLIDATRNSVNTVYAQAQLAVGADRVVDTARALGVTSDLQPNASLTLGTEEVSVLEIAGAFSTLANRGIRVRPRVILEVRTADGTVIEPMRPQPRERVLDRSDADVVTFCLRQVVTRGSGTAAQFGKAFAGKTGTTNDFADAWFVGYTPKLTTAVWMGYPEGNERRMTNVRGRSVNGGSFPATVFRRFMQEATRDARFLGEFPTVSRFPGKVLKGSGRVIFSTTTTTSSTSSTVAPSSVPTEGETPPTSSQPPPTTQPPPVPDG